eukprot:5565761-Ditylum_brightwellii.AAC.1
MELLSAEYDVDIKLQGMRYKERFTVGGYMCQMLLQFLQVLVTDRQNIRRECKVASIRKI